MAKSLGGGPSGTAMPTKKGHGAPKAHRGKQNPPDTVMAPLHTGLAEIRIHNKNAGFGSIYRDREDTPKRGRRGDAFGGG